MEEYLLITEEFHECFSSMVTRQYMTKTLNFWATQKHVLSKAIQLSRRHGAYKLYARNRIVAHGLHNLYRLWNFWDTRRSTHILANAGEMFMPVKVSSQAVPWA
jgi:hypothetical protein